jgi:putative salt-induced outer membrane protein YdiY
MSFLPTLAACLALLAPPDEVVFKNGEKIVGKITNILGGKITIQSDSLGTVSAPLDKVATFSSDEPIEIVLADGSIVKERVKAAEDGAIVVDRVGEPAGRKLFLNQIAKVNPQAVRWTGSLTAGLVFTRGNSDTNNANVDLGLERRTDWDRITFKGSYASTRTRNLTTGDWETSQDYSRAKLQYDYFLTKEIYALLFGLAEKDRIAGLTLRVTAGAGLGEQWADTPDFSFSTEEALTYTIEDFERPTPDDNYLGAMLAYHVKGNLLDGLSGFHDLSYLQSLERADDALIEGQIGVRVALTKAMYCEAKYQLRWDNTPAIGAERLDVRYLVGIGWSF